MTESNDGFVIAEADLKLRGPGDLEGTQQSGIPFDLRIADLVKDNAILFKAREVAQSIIRQDPQLSQPIHRVLKEQLDRIGGNRYEWGRIS